jgi:pre-mRNA-splicing factor CWC26
MSRADYLAQHYLTADPKPEKKSKKRKRKAAEEDAGLTIADDAAAWGNGRTNITNDGDDTPYIAGKTSEFRKKKMSGWTRIGAPPPKDSEQAEADRIIAETVQENRARQEDAEDAPVIEGDAPDLQAMESYTDSGTRAGLQSSKEVQAAAEKMKREERRRMKEAMEEAGVAGTDGTIYRDASGRIINVAMKRAEARRKAEEEEQRKREEAEAAKGDAQRIMKEERVQRLKDAKYMAFTRSADDAELNEELKEVERWNDPAAQFVTAKKKKKSKSGRPLYQGSFQPNRFGIRPGYRWDGVDRSIGFEKKWFEARNRKKDMEDLKYAWEMDE